MSNAGVTGDNLPGKLLTSMNRKLEKELNGKMANTENASLPPRNHHRTGSCLEGKRGKIYILNVNRNFMWNFARIK